MDKWTIVHLPTLHLAEAQDRINDIANWVTVNKIAEDTVAISSRIVRFKHYNDAIFFKLGF